MPMNGAQSPGLASTGGVPPGPWRSRTLEKHRWRLLALATLLGAFFGVVPSSFAGHTCSGGTATGAQVCKVANSFSPQGVTTTWEPKVQTSWQVLLLNASGSAQLLGKGTGTQGSLQWTVPACLPEGSYFTRVEVFDSRTGTADGMPSTAFLIGKSPLPCISNAWVDYSGLQQGQVQTVRWTSQNQASVALYLHRPSGGTWGPVDMRPYGGGADGRVFSANSAVQSAQWPVPATFPTGTYAFLVRTWNLAGETRERYTTYSFEVLPKPPGPTIGPVTASPSVVNPGTPMTVSWSSTNQDGYTVERCRADGSGCAVIAAKRPSTATSVGWTVPTSLPPDSYKMKVTLTNAQNETAVGFSNVFTLQPPVTSAVVSLFGADTHVRESIGTVTVQVQVTTPDGGPTGAPITADYTTKDGTAVAGSDYTAVSGSVTFPSGSAHGTTRQVTIPIIKDSQVEPRENFELRLTRASGATVGDKYPVHYVNIDDEAGAPNDAVFVSQSVPSTVGAGQRFNVSVTMKNTGTNTWTEGTRHALGAQNPSLPPYAWGVGRVPVPSAIAPGAESTFHFTATAPRSAGTYPFQWMMVQEGVDWFGPMTPALNVVVVGSVEPVVWTNPVNVSVSGNSLTKTGAVGWNAGASSTKQLTGDGYVELTAGPRGTHRFFGLGIGDTDQGYADIEFGLEFADTGPVLIYEGGNLRGYFGSYSPGDRSRVAVESGRVRYYRNGELLHESTVLPTLPLVVDTSLFEPGATLSDVGISGPWQ